MDFSNVADSAATVVSQAASGAGPVVISIIGIVVGIGLVVKLLKKAG